MTINSVTSSSAASQAAWVSKIQQSSGAGGAGQVHRPPPPPDGGGLVGAIADALQSIGVTASGAVDDGSATASTDSTDAAASNPAQALGSFLHELMGALHEQGAAAQSGGQGTPDGQSYGPPGGAGGPGGPGGGAGRLAADLQSLITKLGSSDSTDSTDSTTATDDTGSTASTVSSALETAFSNLLQALGTDTADAGSKLSSFLQTLADKLPSAGSSGNLINTSV